MGSGAVKHSRLDHYSSMFNLILSRLRWSGFLTTSIEQPAPLSWVVMEGSRVVASLTSQPWPVGRQLWSMGEGVCGGGGRNLTLTRCCTVLGEWLCFSFYNFQFVMIFVWFVTLRFILPCKSECQPIIQNSIQIFQIKFLFLVQSFQKHIALVYFI